MTSIWKLICATALVLSVVTPLKTAAAGEDPAIDALRAEGRAQGWTFEVKANEVMKRTASERNGFRVPEGWRRQLMIVKPKSTGTLPAHFDWREQGSGLTPIKDQGQCGSCWAFSTSATFENAILLKDKAKRDLSEQFIVSCNGVGWGCSGGWWDFNLFENPGAVYTPDFPYQAQDVACPSSLPTHETLSSWAFVDGVQSFNGVPTVDALKQAIFTHGPISVAIDASNASFSAYSSGVYNDCGTAPQIDHAVNLVGWDDAGGYWIMRNSWGTSWGEQGYMKIKYGCDAIGFAATFNNYKPACNPQPAAIPGKDVTITAGQKAQIGSAPQAGSTYQWSPADGLSSATEAQPMASPTASTEYTLTVSNACGSASQTIQVTVH